ncbi:GDP-6-deoxy-D-lyxo-4-hexulose reductase [Parasaccharibacter sp. TMW2.1882]|uniref:GDP-6-deoxy-D-lyxo-4-hexulose reductase n=1 Tax=Parasaccharibacter apium TaxID=1510841 RepID=A0ABX4ZNJ8_9PROT|nr:MULTISPECIES: NAD-dependent epimerase/dehydratase family protein [Acetobacteraceae]MCK8636674.1 GDP-6-deoxy-D-lyxo-4-hexulose reductase [Parasaccharibacter sp. TMW2.1885]MCL1496214.1 GDP-6-deoxy-D-lyxo-4-hexulose reductase [Parasaccharibacter sp. TMW2.1882]POS62576.1 GDP-6-deoxy-D-lyxo-4-hexulose reductase [Parasaccharibacter apium]POS63673.1 GDP-6-deoxy-D-lyxo-4-hexulose reductase [Parasaccharibacter apium]POS63816.1 GDP-6-deoxy-D-lyxo-4-hexulose reductase [Parasaccharibacter apium]
MSRRILITGASGFVGRHLTSLLKAHPSKDLIFDERFDVTNILEVSDVVRRVQPDACVHLAGVTSIAQARQDRNKAWNVNLQGTLNVAQALLAYAPQATLVFSSSSEIYGDSFLTGEALDENALLIPNNPYSVTKAAADLSLGAMVREGLKVIRVRPFNHTGAGQVENFVVAAFARQIAKIEVGTQRPVVEVGNLDAERDFLDVRDVCEAYKACIDRSQDIPSGVILNICSGQTRSIRSILEKLVNFSKVEIEIRVKKELLRPVDVRYARGSNELACKILHWQPKVLWEETLQSVLNYWREKERSASIS